MLKNQFQKVGRHIVSQGQKLLGVERRKFRKKRQFIEGYIDKIQPSVPLISREDIAIIATGLLSELRGMDLETAYSVIQEEV